MIPNVFISSTIDDLRYLRDALRDAVLDLAYHPVMSEYGEVGYLHPVTAAESCYRSVQQCQMAIIIIGRRYGEPSEDGISVTHKEFRTAREHDIPLVGFVEANVLNYKEVYKTNPDPNTWQKFPQMDHPEQTFSLIDEVTSAKSYNGLIPFTNISDAKKALKRQIADFVGNSLSQIINPMRTEIKDVLAEIKTLRHELSSERTFDPNFMTVLRFFLDDQKAGSYRYLIEHIAGPLDGAIPMLIKASSFEKFIAKTGFKIVVKNNIKGMRAGDPRPEMVGGMAFAVTAINDPKGFGTAEFVILREKTIEMNQYAKNHFDQLHQQLKTLIKTKQTDKG